MKSYRSTNRRNRDKLLLWIRNNIGYATPAIADAMGWSTGYTRQLLNWLYRDDLVMFVWSAKPNRVKAWWPTTYEGGYKGGES